MVIADGLLDVGDGHRIHWEEWGTAGDGPLFVCLHGGPGGGTRPSHRDMFDPARHHVLFHDQRGCGRSLPSGEIAANTAQHLVADVDRLLDERGVEQAIITGGSWGSTLALLYALHRPERVAELLLWSIYLGRRSDDDYVNAGYAGPYFPEAWERFIGFVPVEARATSASTMEWYRREVFGDDDGRAYRAALEWTLWESTLCSIEYDPEKLLDELSAESAKDLIAGARLETHYFTNGCFIETPLLERVHEIAHIPCHAVHGRFDMCTPASGAVALKDAYGDRMTLEFVNAGHLRTEPAMAAALRAAAARLVA